MSDPAPRFTLSADEVASYLARLGLVGPLPPTVETLRLLHRTHLSRVPFENLDIHLGRNIVLDGRRLFDKVVGERRGGFCYEVNGLFAALLCALGFEVTLLSAQVAGQDGTLGREFDHLALRVDVGEPLLADVGFGDAFLEPLRLQPGLLQPEGDQTFRLDQEGEAWTLWERRAGGAWGRQYRFTLTPRELAEFAPMCDYHQTSPDSHFTRAALVTVVTPEGRVTLRGDRLYTTVHGQRDERVVSPEERAVLLDEHFGLRVPALPDRR
ncbi:arylamine N-acetyltransferase family protein [Deinococcus aestuarii]|uniref:arylamine N-acetyltransferase family protein n=1 Tax=Deinococcus aestuarii TaxID=2774531 RepID=UPI001C0E4FFC|nr:arylamine N-acetyltransferase [Deinococcus aestuarii]